MNIIQFENGVGDRQVGVLDKNIVRVVDGFTTTYALVQEALKQHKPLPSVVEVVGYSGTEVVSEIENEGRMLCPIDHPDPAHVVVTGTGLTHLGSASARDSMHKDEAEKATDSMKMFNLGLANGKPDEGQIGVQPEWFFKGNGDALVAPGCPLTSPAFALDAGEEPEIAGVYIISPRGVPMRIGYCLANEFSDHVTERRNYLYLAHSKLRPCSIGPSLSLAPLPSHVEGMSRILRNGKPIWEKPFYSGEDNMSHSLRNLEYHHFKYDLFRRPGDIHVHMFGTATLSHTDSIMTQPGDLFEISATHFPRSLRNPLAVATEESREIGELY